jgi:hypothetical protein
VEGSSFSQAVNVVVNNVTTSGNSGTGTSDGSGTTTGSEDYSSAKIVNCDSRVKVEIISCKRSDSTVTFNYRLTNTGMGDINDFRIYPPKSQSMINGGTYTSIWTDDNVQYYYPTINFNGKTESGTYALGTTFPQDVPCSGYVKITEVSSNAKKLNVYLGVYVYSLGDLRLDNSVIKFTDIPIY